MKIYFRKIYLSNEKNAPVKGPAIYAVNHPTAFIDPIALAALTKPTMNFMLRGDMFKSPIGNFFLDQINTIPIFRFRDGFAKLKNNADTMDAVYQKLNDGRNILILAEGQTKHEKKMRPIQKGAARMAFGAYEKLGTTDIKIIPVGVNYTDSHKFRSEMFIDIGPPILMSDYLDSHTENSRKAIKDLTDDISKGMRARIIHIENSEREPTANILLAIKRKLKQDRLLPIMEDDDNPLQTEWQLAEKINNCSEENFEPIKSVANDYQELLTGLGLTETAVAQPYQYSLFNSFTLLIGFLPFLIGYLFNALPLWLAKFIADKKVKKIEFHASMRYAAGWGLWMIYFIVLAIVLAFFNWKFWMILCLPFLGYFAIIWRDLFLDWNGARAYKGLPMSTKKEFEEMRGELLKFVE